MLWLNIYCILCTSQLFLSYLRKIHLQSCDNQVTFHEKVADEQAPCANCGRPTVSCSHSHSSNSSSIILEDLYHKRSSEQEMTSTSLFFEIITYVSSASLLLMLT